MNADRIAEVYLGTHGSEEVQRRARQRVHWMCAAAAGTQILDIGCSQGIASLLLGREGRAATGVDREHQAIEYARGLLREEEEAVKGRVSFCVAEAAALPFGDGSFDAVLLGEVLEHQVDPAPILDEARRCLRDDGTLVVTTPYGIFPYHDHKEPFYLGPLLELLGARVSVSEIQLLGAYLGIVGRARRGRRFDPLLALGVAEERLRQQDETVWSQRSSIKAHKTAAEKRKRELDERDDELVSARRSLAQVEAQADARDVERQASRERIVELEGVLSAARDRTAEADGLRETVAALRREIGERSSELELARERLSEIEVRAARVDAELAESRSQVLGLEAQDQERGQALEAARQQATGAAARAAGSEGALGESRERIAALEDEVKERTRRLETSWQEVADVGTRFAAHQAELEESRKRVAELEESLGGAQQEAATAVGLRERVAGLEREVEQRGLRVESLERELELGAEQLRERTAALERAESLRLEVEDLREARSVSKAELSNQTRELDELRQRLRQREQESVVQADALKRLIAERDAALAETTSHEEKAAELALLRDRLSEALERRSHEATARARALEEAKGEGEAAQAELRDLRTRLAQLEQRGLGLDEELKDQHAEIVRGQATKRALQVRVTGRESDLKQAQGREREHVTTIDSLRSQVIALHRRSLGTGSEPRDGHFGLSHLPKPPLQAGPKGAATEPPKTMPFQPADAHRSAVEALAPTVPKHDPGAPSPVEAEKATQERPEDPRAWRELAKAHERAKDLDAAADAALRALALEPTRRTSIWTAARTLSRLGPDSRFGEVVDCLGPLSKLDDDSLARVRDVAIRACDHERMLALGEEAHRRGDTDPKWVGPVASAHWELDAEVKAEELVEPLLASRAPDPSLKAAAGFFLHIGDADRAWDALTRMASPDRPLMVDAARQLIRTGRLREALSSLDEVLMLAPSNAAALEARAATSSSLEVVEDRWAKATAKQPLARVRGRVLHLLQRTFPYHLAGNSVRTHAIGRAQLAAGIDVHVVTQPDFPWNVGADPNASELDVVDGVSYHRLRDPEGEGKRALGQQLRRYACLVAPLIEELRPAALHPASNYINALVALELSKCFDIPVIYEVRGFPEERLLAKRGSRLRTDPYSLARQLELRCWQRADHITTLAETMKRHMVERGVDAGKITVVPNAVEPQEWKPIPKDHDLAAQLGLAEGTTVVGYISTFAPYDGIEYLLEAVGLLRKRECDVHCLLVGGGSERRFLEQKATSLGLGGHVTFTGVVPHDQVKRYYSLIDVFVVPRTNEAVSHLVTPLKPYEAMAMQRAVVVSGTAALREMVDDGHTGLCFEPESSEDLAVKIELLAANPDRREALARSGREWVIQNRTWEANARLYAGVYLGLDAL